MFAHYFKHFDNDIFVTFLFFACIFLALAAVWDIYFVKMILYYTRLYRESIKEAKTDILDNSLELALHYKAEIVKVRLRPDSENLENLVRNSNSNEIGAYIYLRIQTNFTISLED